MRLVGSASWEYRKLGGGGRLDRALYLRDAFDLPTERGGQTPPWSAPVAARLPRMLSEAERHDAGASWPRWWHQLLDSEVDASRLTPGEVLEGFRARHPTRNAERSPLAEWPALAKAATIAKTHGANWLREQQNVSLPATMSRPSDYPVAKAEAERIIAAGVDPEAVRAIVLELLTPGMWWRRAGAGVVVCAAQAMDDPETARAVLRDAYTSGVPPAGHPDQSF